MSTSSIEILKKYSACDVSDALLALEKPSPGQRKTAGFLCDLVHLNKSALRPANQSQAGGMLVYPAYTVQFRSTSPSAPTSTVAPQATESNIPSGAQWSDLAAQDCIVVIQQPSDQKCAVAGGIHMLRLCKRGVKGLVVDGRVRDINDLQNLDMPVWAKGTSTVGAAAEGKPHAVQVTVSVSEIMIEPGDLICIDSRENGVVRIPTSLIEDVISWLGKRGDSEDQILAMVREGSSVADAFKKYR